jgi:SAM-dependent methyltransferase
MSINYNHSLNIHTVTGASTALYSLIAKEHITSLLDVGCGSGFWLRSAIELGIPDVLGIEGVDIPDEQLMVSPCIINKHDLTKELDLRKKFDLVLCLEVGEHLKSEFAVTLIRSLTNHGERIFFSAACPFQPGQNHVNCQWPEYWQEKFNALGYYCIDTLRQDIWDNSDIEWWYRQNLFEARYDPSQAGKEPRIKKLVHPGLLELAHSCAYDDGFKKGYIARKQSFLRGEMPYLHYVAIPFIAVTSKFYRCFSRFFQ